MDGTYTATGKSTKTGGLPGTPSGTPPRGGSSGGPPPRGPRGAGIFPPGGGNSAPPGGPYGGRKNPKIADFGGFWGFSGKKAILADFPYQTLQDLAKTPLYGVWAPRAPFLSWAPRAPKLTPRGWDTPGGKKCTFSRVFNNSPSRDAMISPPGHHPGPLRDPLRYPLLGGDP